MHLKQAMRQPIMQVSRPVRERRTQSQSGLSPLHKVNEHLTASPVALQCIGMCFAAESSISVHDNSDMPRNLVRPQHKQHK
jgi:hypothetical protein